MWISSAKSVSIKDICARDRNIAISYAKLLIKIENRWYIYIKCQIIIQPFVTVTIDTFNIARKTRVPEYLYYLCLFYAHPDSSAATRTRPDSYSPRAFVSSHSRKLANAQTERSVAATSTVLVTESVLSSTYQHCYWMRWESLYRKNDFTTLYRVRRWYLIIQLLSYYLYVACTFMQGTW